MSRSSQLTVQEHHFKFLPIEPIRSPPNKRESFARKQHQFSPANLFPQAQGFAFKKPSRPPSQGPPPSISIDGRLPDPAIITCNAPLPLRIIIKKLNDTDQTVFLGTIQLLLIAKTRIRAHELVRVERNSWVILSKANLRMPVGGLDVPRGKEIEIDRDLWARLPLPNAICPSFETCNISREYELKVSVGLMYGTSKDIKVRC